MNRADLKKKVRVTAEILLREKGYISPVDLLIKMDSLSTKEYEDWRHGRVPYLEKVCRGNLSQLSAIMVELRQIAFENNLRPSWTGYNKGGKGAKIKLRFSKSGDSKIEESYATHYRGSIATKESQEKD